jgi:hypothetical protein
MTVPVDLMYGSQTFKHGSSKVTIFAYEGEKRILPSKIMSKVGPGGRTSAAKDGSYANGMWYHSTFEPIEGLVLGIQTYTTFHGATHTNCMLLLQLRNDASTIQVDTNLCISAEATYKTLPAFLGKADVITPRQATKDAGVIFTPFVYKQLFDEEEIEEEFFIHVLAKGRPRPKLVKVKDSSGRTRRLAIPEEPRRRIKVRRKNE